MVTVHHLNNSRSQRVLWLLEELGVPYQVQRYQRDAATMLAPAALKAVHPLGKSPVVVDDGATIAESGAIVEYLVGRYGNGRLAPAPGTPERLRYTYWLHYAEGSLMPLLVMKLLFGRVLQAPMPFFARPIARRIVGGIEGGYVGPNLVRHLDFVESELGAHPWFAGEQFSAADIQMSFPLEAAAARAGGPERPHTRAFLERIHALPAYRRALEAGGPYALLS
jgi:glutathione S-transferase